MPADPYIQIAPGKRFYFEVSDPGTIEQMARNLSRIFRFNGRGISVAEHSVHVCDLLPVRYKLPGLLHDGQEHLVGDMSSPMKGKVPEFRGPEAIARYAISQKYGVPYVLPSIVKQADFASLIVEAEALGFDTTTWEGRNGIQVPQFEIKNLSSEDAEVLFLERYHALTDMPPAWSVLK